MRPAFLLLISLALAPSTAVAQKPSRQPSAFLDAGPELGARPADFSLPWATKDGPGGEQWFSLGVQRGKVVVLAFYPKDFTAGCTAEMRTFTERYNELFGEGVEVLGINADSLDTHVRFASSLGLPFKLLTDKDQAVSRRFSSAGENGYNRRTVYVIGKKGEVVYRELSFVALDPKSYDRLREAVQSARRQR